MENSVETGLNRTGLDMAPASKDDMVRFAQAQGSQDPATSSAISDLRRDYARKAERLGSVPVALRMKGGAASMADTRVGHKTVVLVDKLGERLAYERTGVRLYEALHSKVASAPGGLRIDSDKLMRIRDDEEAHFHLLARCLVSMGADPTAVTPCADIAGMTVVGPLQVLTDPRTTLAQALNAMLLIEMGDNAGWDLLCELAGECGHPELAESFAGVIDAERQHLETVQGWLCQVVLDEAS